MNSQMMILADGNVTEYDAIRKLSVKSYLTKFEDYIHKIELAERARR